MHPERRIRLSKFLSLVLRHRPEQAGVTLDGHGRVAVDALLSGLRESGWEDLTRGEIEEVARVDARRFEVLDGLIRARYGHSLMLERPGPAVRPPEWLYLAVLEEQMPAVVARGLVPDQRRYLHLCDTPQEAARVLTRHPIPGQVVTVLARRAHDGGVPFYRATDRLLLTPPIPPEYVLRRPT